MSLMGMFRQLAAHTSPICLQLRFFPESSTHQMCNLASMANRLQLSAMGVFQQLFDRILSVDEDS
jgi:hypothetical protein